MVGGGSSAAPSTPRSKEPGVPISRLSAASNTANDCQARRCCGSVRAVIPQSHASYAVGSMAIPFVGQRLYLTNINRQHHKSLYFCLYLTCLAVRPDGASWLGRRTRFTLRTQLCPMPVGPTGCSWHGTNGQTTCNFQV